MDREWLAQELALGRAIEAIAREVGKDPSTVAYWATKYDLASMLADKHAAKGPIGRKELERAVQDGLTLERLAAEFQRSSSSIRHWLAKYGLQTVRARQGPRSPALARSCVAARNTATPRTCEPAPRAVIAASAAVASTS